MPKKVIFENSPLSELVIGVQYKSPIISNDKIFSYYATHLKDEFPNISEHPRLPSVVEDASKNPIPTVIGGNETRKFFHHRKGEKLIQLQNNKFLFNWKKTDDLSQYPHFDNVFSEFSKRFKELNKICDFEQEIDQYELTYQDHILVEEFMNYNSGYELEDIFSKIKFPQSIKSINSFFSIGNTRINGALNVKIQSAIRNNDQKKLIVFETTCRGYDNSGDMGNWYEIAHDILINFFLNNITEKAKKIWGMKN